MESGSEASQSRSRTASATHSERSSLGSEGSRTRGTTETRTSRSPSPSESRSRSPSESEDPRGAFSSSHTTTGRGSSYRSTTSQPYSESESETDTQTRSSSNTARRSDDPGRRVGEEERSTASEGELRGRTGRSSGSEISYSEGSSSSRDVGQPRSTTSFSGSESGSQARGSSRSTMSSTMSEEERSSVIDDMSRTTRTTPTDRGSSYSSYSSTPATRTSTSSRTASRTSPSRTSTHHASSHSGPRGESSSSRRTESSSHRVRELESDDETGESGESSEEIEEFETRSEEEERLALLHRSNRTGGSRSGSGSGSRSRGSGSGGHGGSGGGSSGRIREEEEGRGSRTGGSRSASGSGSRSRGSGSGGHGASGEGGDRPGGVELSEDEGSELHSSAVSTSLPRPFSADDEEISEREYFCRLPVGPTLVLPGTCADPFINGYNVTVEQVRTHIRDNIQKQEIQVLKDLSTALCKENAERSDEEVQREYIKLQRVRDTRHRYRGVLYDAMQQRLGILEAYEWRKVFERAKGEQEDNPKRGLDWIFFFFLLFEVLIFISFNIVTDFANLREITDQNTGKTSADGREFYVSEYYFTFTGISFVAFLGLPFLGAFTQRASFSSVGMGLFAGTFGFQWGLLMNLFFRYIDASDSFVININMIDLIQGAYAAVAAVITFAIMVGTVNTGQLIILLVFEGFFYAFNYYIGWMVLHTYDLGALYVHIFAGFFGCGLTLKNLFGRTKHSAWETIGSRYAADIFAIIGAIILWIFWPAFNAALAPQGTQFQAIFNSVLSLLASGIIAFVLSRFTQHFTAQEIRNAMLAGAIMTATVVSLVIEPWVALVLGVAGGLLTFSGTIFTNVLGPKTGIKDPAGVFWLHGLTGALSSLAALLALSIVKGDSIFGVPYDQIFWQAHSGQHWLQIVVLGISVAMGVIGGLFTSVILLGLERWTSSEDTNYNDNRDFRVPQDFPDSFIKRAN